MFLPPAQEYLFRVKCPGAKSSDGMITIGKADVDLAEFVDCPSSRLKTVSIEVSHWPYTNHHHRRGAHSVQQPESVLQ